MPEIGFSRGDVIIVNFCKTFESKLLFKIYKKCNYSIQFTKPIYGIKLSIPADTEIVPQTDPPPK